MLARLGRFWFSLVFPVYSISSTCNNFVPSWNLVFSSFRTVKAKLVQSRSDTVCALIDFSCHLKSVVSDCGVGNMSEWYLYFAGMFAVFTHFLLSLQVWLCLFLSLLLVSILLWIFHKPTWVPYKGHRTNISTQKALVYLYATLFNQSKFCTNSGFHWCIWKKFWMYVEEDQVCPCLLMIPPFPLTCVQTPSSLCCSHNRSHCSAWRRALLSLEK